MAKIKLGDEVKDEVSGFQGIAISEHKYLEGCNRIGVQPPVNEKGELPNAHTFDGPTLTIIKKQVVKPSEANKPPSKRKGGPEKHMPEERR